MSQYHVRGLKKKSGGMRRPSHKKHKAELGGKWTATKVGETRRSLMKTLGGNLKAKLFEADFVNVVDPKTQKSTKTKIKGVLDHPDNQHYTRRLIITKGCTLDTEIGKVKVTSRPGQSGVVNGILI